MSLAAGAAVGRPGIRDISRTTVANILRKNGFDPGPKRGQATWDEFVKRHVSTLWACDFFSKKIWTSGGFIEYFVLFFIHIGSRRVHIAGMSTHPNHVWMAQQARNVCMFCMFSCSSTTNPTSPVS